MFSFSHSRIHELSRAWPAGLLARCLLGVSLILAALETHAQGTSKEYQLKAVLLWRLAQYVEFPPDALGPTNSPIVIAVVGENPFGEALRIAVENESAQGRRIEVHHSSDGTVPADAHIVFISQSERAHIRALTASARGRNVLTVSDIETFARSDNGMVRFAMEQNRVTLQVNLEALNAAHLKLDSRVLRMADIVKESR